MSVLRAAWRVAILAPVTAVGMPTQWAAVKLGLPAARAIPVLYHRFVCRVLGIRIVVKGTPPQRAPVLILSNHVSWLDVPIISSLMPVSFVAKQEIGSWPFFGSLARLQRSVFIDRTRRHATTDANAVIAGRLAAGDAIVLFAEGTTGDGTRLLPFRTALVGAARHLMAKEGAAQVELKPLSVAYVARHGLPLGRAGRSTVAWFGDLDLVPHFFDILKGAPFDIVVEWGEAVPFEGDRKVATRLAEVRVRDSLTKALRQR
jgi:1-acyl-sn-glycerol-3-phosphate acyltransferase